MNADRSAAATTEATIDDSKSMKLKGVSDVQLR